MQNSGKQISGLESNLSDQKNRMSEELRQAQMESARQKAESEKLRRTERDGRPLEIPE